MTGRWPKRRSRQSAQSFALLAHARVPARSLGFHERERLVIVAPQHVIDVALAPVVGHAVDLVLAVAGLVERPASFLEQEERPRHDKFNVIRVRGDSEGRGGHVRRVREAAVFRRQVFR